jgi:hypothetical protein
MNIKNPMRTVLSEVPVLYELSKMDPFHTYFKQNMGKSDTVTERIGLNTRFWNHISLIQEQLAQLNLLRGGRVRLSG